MNKLLGILFAAAIVPTTASALEWTKFRDPVEGAFTIDVPAGWQVAGGIKRRSTDQPHPIVGVLSPDRLTKIVLGDPNTIAYSELTPQMRMLGFREGQSYTPHGEPEIIKNYRPGAEWAAELARQELAQDECTGVKVLKLQVLPKLYRGLPAPAGVEHRDSVGEAYLSCVRHNILYAAYGFSETGGDYYYQGGRVLAGLWTDDTSVVVLTPQGLGAQAMAVAGHMLHSIQWDQGWWQRQFHATTAQANALYAQSTQAVAAQSTNWDRTIRGVADYTNPQTGKTMEVPITGGSGVAQDAAGNVVDFVGSTPPPGFTALKKVPN